MGVVFCIDLDNVIARTDDVMRRVIEDYTNGRVRLSYEDIVRFNYYECVDKWANGITKEQWKVVHSLFSEPRYLWQVEPVAGAVDALKELAEHGSIHIATARLRTARRTTVEWIDYYKIPAHELHFLRHGEKHASLRAFTAAVEDDYEQAVAFAKQGGTPGYLLSHPWNANRAPIDGVVWVENWAELSRALIALARAY